MQGTAGYIKHCLQFKKTATTSRGDMNFHDVWYLFIIYQDYILMGEVAPLPKLSRDNITEIPDILNEICKGYNQKGIFPDEHFVDYPSIQFAIDSIRYSQKSNKTISIYIPVNGLIWMDTIDSMYQSVKEKISVGYTTIKLKIGAQNFEDELRLIYKIRQEYSSESIQIRLDANGAFPNDDALIMLKELHRYYIHSIEQPIQPGQIDFMEYLCKESPIPIALDEELFIEYIQNQQEFIKTVKPQYIVIKPSLIGGYMLCERWIKAAEDNQIGWWVTSALESNIGLESIAAWLSEHNIKIPQGLGTGKLYANNLPGFLQINKGYLEGKINVKKRKEIFHTLNQINTIRREDEIE